MKFTLAIYVCLAQAAPTPEPIEIGVYAPSIFFPNVEAQAGFLSSLERSMSAVTQAEVTASISNAKRLREFDFWLLDAPVAAARGAIVIKQATNKGVSEVPMALYARAGAAAQSVLVPGRLAIPGGDGAWRATLRHWLLLNEPIARRVAASAGESRDARGAASALAAAYHEGALLYEIPYSNLHAGLAGIEVVARLGSVPLPVLAVNPTKGVSSEVIERAKRVQLPTVVGTIDGWSSKAGTIADLRRSVTKGESRVARTYLLAEAPTLREDLSPLLVSAPRQPPLKPSEVMPAPEYIELPFIPLAGKPTVVSSRVP